MSQHRLRGFAGPKGSGKSTLLIAFLKKIDGGLNLEIDSEDLPTWFLKYVLSFYSA